MKSSLSLLFFLAAVLSPLSVRAEDLLFGVDAGSTPIVFDTRSFTPSVLTNTSIPYSLWQHPATCDPSNGVFYIVGYDLNSRSYFALGINIKTGELDTQLRLPFSAGPIINKGVFLNFNNPTKELLITGPCSDNISHHCVISVATDTGSWIEISRIEVGTDSSGALSAFDPVNGIEYIILSEGNSNQQTLMGVNVRDRSIRRTTINGGNVFSTLHYDPQTRSLFGMGFNQNQSLSIMQIDPRSDSNIKIVAALPKYKKILGSMAALNNGSHRLYTFLTNSDQSFPYISYEFVSLDLNTGNILSAVAACTSTTCPISICSL